MRMGGGLEDHARAPARALSARRVRTQPEGGRQARKRTLTGNQRGRHLMLGVSSEAQRGLLLSVKR